MNATLITMESGKKCSKRSRSSSSSSDASRKKGHLKKTKMSSKVEHYRAKKCSDIEGDSAELASIKVERKGRKVKERTSRSSEESSSFSSSESEKWPKEKKQKEKKRKEKKQKEKKQKGKKKKHKREKAEKVRGRNDLNSENQNNLREGTSKEVQEEMNVEPGPVKPANSTEEPKQRAMAPMTKEEYDKQQSKVRRVFDHETGRERLVKGEGEIIEEIVSSKRHQAINKLATAGDGAAFQKSLGLNRYDHDNKIYRS